jgi:hypothetical protein
LTNSRDTSFAVGSSEARIRPSSNGTTRSPLA